VRENIREMIGHTLTHIHAQHIYIYTDAHVHTNIHPRTHPHTHAHRQLAEHTRTHPHTHAHRQLAEGWRRRHLARVLRACVSCVTRRLCMSAGALVSHVRA